MSINDVRFYALGDQGFEGAINDRTLAWLQANGATSGQLNDAWMEMLILQGATSRQVNTAWFEVLGDLGFDGTLKDREYQFWVGGGMFPQVLWLDTQAWIDSELWFD